MNTIEMIKWGKGYYIIRRFGGNVVREWRKTKKEAEKLMKEWAEG